MEKIINDFSTDNKVKCFCNECRKIMNHTVIKSVKKLWKDDTDEYAVNGYDDYQIIKCSGCDTYTFRIDGYFSEYAEPFPGGSNGTYEKLYPESIRRKAKEFQKLPYNLQSVYEEAVKSFNNNQYILCAVGIRSILDGVCIDQKIDKGSVEYKNEKNEMKTRLSDSLDGKINGLNEKGIISKSQTQALHELRFMGNKAVHELEEPQHADLQTAFDIIEHILMDIYDLPIKSDELKKKRNKT